MAFVVTNIGTANQAASNPVNVTVGAGGVPSGAIIFLNTIEANNTTSTSGGSVATTAGDTIAFIQGGQTNGSNGYVASWQGFTTGLVNGNTIGYTRAVGSTNHCAISVCYILGAFGIDSGVNATNANISSTLQPAVTSGVPKVGGELFVGTLGVSLGASGTTTGFTQDSINGAWASVPVESLYTAGSGNGGTDGGNVVRIAKTAQTWAPNITTALNYRIFITAFIPGVLAGYEQVQSQPVATRRNLATRSAARTRNSFAFFDPWVNAGWEIQPPPPPRRRWERFAAIAPKHDGTEAPYVQWRNAGLEVQPPQPPKPRPERFAGLYTNEDGIEAPFVFVAPPVSTLMGWEVQPTHLLPRSYPAARGVPTVCEDGIEAPFQQWLNSGWEVAPHQPQHPRIEVRGAIMPKEDGTEAPYIQWSNVGYEFQITTLLPRFYPAARTVPNSGDDGTQSPYIQWRNLFEVHPPQPPHPRREKFGALAARDDGNEYIYQQWQNGGWEVQPHQPPHPRPERFGAIVPKEDGTYSIYQLWTNAGWEIQAVQPPRNRWERRSGASVIGDTGTEAPFVNWINQGWSLTTADIVHRILKSPDIGDGGIEAVFFAVVVTTPAWGFEPQFVNYRKRPRFADTPPPPDATFTQWVNQGWAIQYSDLVHRIWKSPDIGDGGIEAPFIAVFVAPPAWGFEEQPLAYYRQPKTRAAGIAGRSEFASFAEWVNAGWEVQYQDVRHQILKSPDVGDGGIESPFVFVGVNTWGFEPQLLAYRRRLRSLDSNPLPDGLYNQWVNAGWAIQYVDMLHRIWKSPDVGDGGIELPYQQWRNAGWEIQPPPPPRPRWERRAVGQIVGDPVPVNTLVVWVNAGAVQYVDLPHRIYHHPDTGDTGIQGPFQRFIPYGWEIAPPPPPRNQWEKRAVGEVIGDQGNYAPLFFPNVPLTAWEFNPSLMVPSRTQLNSTRFAGIISYPMDTTQGFVPKVAIYFGQRQSKLMKPLGQGKQ